jgi:SAM-dependent methyltransferase
MSTVPSHVCTSTSHLHSFFAHDFVVALHPHIIQAPTILDIGCGFGAFAYAYMNQYPNGIKGQIIISIDIDPNVIKQVKRLVKNILETKRRSGQPFYTKLIFQVEDGSRLRGIKDESIDMVVSLYGVFLIPNQTGTLQSIHRVLKSKHGIFANVSWVETSIPGFEGSSSSSSDTKSNTGSILMDPSFGGNYHAALDYMNISAVKMLKRLPSSFTKDHKNACTVEWHDPTNIEQNLNKFHFHHTQTHRTFHSVVFDHINTFVEKCLHNEYVNLNNLLSKQQKLFLQRKFIDFCPDEEELKGASSNKDDKYQQPFSLWSASNITITQKHEQKAVLSSKWHISTDTPRLTWLVTNDLLVLLHPHIKKAKMILEIGCSDRTFIESYIQQYPNGIKGQTIILTDVDPDVIDEMTTEVNHVIDTKRNHGQQFHTKIIVQTIDGSQLHDISDESIDIVVSLYQVVSMAEGILQSIRRVLKPNRGIFANVAWAVPSAPPSSFTAVSTSDIMIDPSFGRNYHTTFYRIYMTAMETLNKTLGSASFFAPYRDQDSHLLQWTDPMMIEQKLKECDFGHTTTHRILHSKVLENSDFLLDLCLDNSNMSRAKLSKEQLDMLKHTMFDLSLLDQEDEPFATWTLSNVTISRVNRD